MKNLPDKIYLSFGEMSEDRFEKEDYKEFCEYHNNLVAFNEHKFWDTDVEYTRTDAFIEKAVEYIANNMRCDGYTLQTKAKFIKEFRNYLKEIKYEEKEY